MKNSGDYTHPWGREWKPDEGPIPYLDRMGFRLPSWIPPSPEGVGPEGGLSLHVDQNPFNPFLMSGGLSRLTKWRPFQSFITISDHQMPNNGGLCVVDGFHKEAERFWSSCSEKVRAENKNNVGGEFYRMHHYGGLKCVQVLAPPGSLVVWDNRLPHCTTTTCDNPLGRKVVYGSWLPPVEINRKYVERQRENLEGVFILLQKMTLGSVIRPQI
jgi:hypothetical protein